MKVMRAADGCVHFSDLKKMAISPAHYASACKNRTAETPSMRIGTACHRLTLGGDMAVWGGTRKDPGWKKFALDNAGRFIVTKPEHDIAVQMSSSILSHPTARELLTDARYEVPLDWEFMGIKCSTGGVDFINEGIYGDLKTTVSASPDRFPRDLYSKFYHCQLAFYEEGMKANGIYVGTPYIIAIENKPPYTCAVYEMSDATMNVARQTVRLWMEKLINCELSGHFPGYPECAILVDPPTWSEAIAGDEEDEAPYEIQ